MPLQFPIYMDDNASTPVDTSVFEAMKPYFCDTFGNAASSGHSFGWASAQAVNHAAKQVAALLHCDRDEIIWTSGTTESNNLALKGIAESCRDRGRHIITQTTNRSSIRSSDCRKMAMRSPGCRWTAAGGSIWILCATRFGRTRFLFRSCG